MLDANTVGDLAHLALSHLDDGRSTTLAGSTLVGAAIGLGTSTARCSAEDKALSGGAHNTPLVVGGSAICLGTERSMLDANTVGDLAHLALSHLDDGRSTTLAGSTLVGAAIGLGTSIARCSAEDKALSSGAHNTPL